VQASRMKSSSRPPKHYGPTSRTVATLAGSSAHVTELQMQRGVVVTEEGYLVADTGNHCV
jgi:hypothetical protein